ncbi:hypothetical protein H7Y40_01715 [Pedobacter sp.]|nr:hypothetical protein [Candidatus Saccharibacteria bacterium]
MSEINPFKKQHLLIPSLRLEYGAVPLDPWNTSHSQDGEDESYLTASLEHIHSKVQLAIEKAREDGLMSEDALQHFAVLLEGHLFDAQTRRIDLHASRSLDDINLDDPRVANALQGTANPTDLLGVLLDNPKRKSIELGKLTHPLDYSATGPMISAVVDAVSNHGGDLIEDTLVRYKRKHYDPDFPALFVGEKYDIARVPFGKNGVTITVRSGNIARGDAEATELLPYVDRKIKNEDRFDELVAAIGGIATRQDCKWYLSTSSSVFAHINL